MFHLNDLQGARRLLACTVLAAAAPACWAQSQPSAYGVTYALKPVVIGLKTEFSQARHLNNRGEVLGWVNQSAGKVLKWVTNDNGGNPFPLFNLTTLTQVDAMTVSPVLWTQGTPKVLTRYGGNTSTWPLGFAGDDTLVMSLAPQSGKTDARYGVSSSQYMQVPYSRRSATWRSGQYSMLPDVFYAGRPEIFNGTGSYLGLKSIPNQPMLASVLLRNGQTTDIPAPSGLQGYLAQDVNNDGTVVMNTVAPDNPNLLCHLWKDGQVTPVLATTLPNLGVPVRSRCLAINARGDVAGVLNWTNEQVSPTQYAAAVFRWRAGQLSMSPVEVLNHPEGWENVHIDDQGVVVFAKGIQSVDGPNVTPAIFTTGAPVLLQPLINAPANLPYLKSRWIKLLDVNAAGQILVSEGGQNGSVTPVVLTPR